uniref:Uncharacterized protein n=1 Tax=Setaria italica TaxID=4555 RepID=K4AJM5_SETIT
MQQTFILRKCHQPINATLHNVYSF